MLHTTFTKLHKAGACIEGYQKLAKSLDGVHKYGKDTPIPLDKIIESNGLQDTIWTLRATIEPSEDLLIEFACRCAEHVLHFFEDKYPANKRPRLAIEAARVCIPDKSPKAAAARDAAWAAAAATAARAAAWAGDDAARAAARAAAWNARAAAWNARAAAWAWDAAGARAAAWAGDAARAAAWAGDAAGNAAWNARAAAWNARAAAWAGDDAEEKWQTEQLLELLRNIK